MIVGLFIPAHPLPIHRFGSDRRPGKKFDHFPILRDCVGPPLLRKGKPCQSESHPGQEFIPGQIPLTSHDFHSAAIHDKQSRGPEHVKPVEIEGLFLDVRFHWYEILVDEGSDFIVREGFGLQPNATSSTRCGTEIEQHQPVLSLCVGNRSVCIIVPSDFNRHHKPLSPHYRARPGGLQPTSPSFAIGAASNT